MRIFVLGFFLALLLATPSAAVVTFTSQSRDLLAGATPTGGGLGASDMRNTTALGMWVETASAIFGDDTGGASASASQSSDIVDGLSATMEGDLAADSSPNWGAIARSTLFLTFLLDADTPYSSTLDTTGGTEVGFFTFVSMGSSTNYDANSSGVLSPGLYTFEIVLQAVAGGNGGSASGSYSYGLQLGVPEPSTLVLAAVGALGLLGYLRRRR